MLGELEKARVEGLDFNSIQTDIVRLVRHYVNENYSLYERQLKYLKVEKEDIEMDVYQRLYNRKENQLSNMERYFIQASEKGMKYIVCLLKKIVRISVLQFFRSKAYSNLATVLNYSDVDLSIYDSIDDSKNTILTDYKAEKNIYDKLEYSDLLNKVPKLYYDDLYYKSGDKLEVLTTRKLLDLIVCGYNINDLVEVIVNEEGNSVTKQYMRDRRLEVILLAKEHLEEYKGIKI